MVGEAGLVGEAGWANGEADGRDEVVSERGWTGTRAGPGGSGSVAFTGDAARGGHAAALALRGEGGREVLLGVCESGGRVLLGEGGAAASFVELRGKGESCSPARCSLSPSSLSEGAIGDLSRSSCRRERPVLPPSCATPELPRAPVGALT